MKKLPLIAACATIALSGCDKKEKNYTHSNHRSPICHNQILEISSQIGAATMTTCAPLNEQLSQFLIDQEIITPNLAKQIISQKSCQEIPMPQDYSSDMKGYALQCETKNYENHKIITNYALHFYPIGSSMAGVQNAVVQTLNEDNYGYQIDVVYSSETGSYSDYHSQVNNNDD